MEVTRRCYAVARCLTRKRSFSTAETAALVIDVLSPWPGGKVAVR